MEKQIIMTRDKNKITIMNRNGGESNNQYDTNIYKFYYKVLGDNPFNIVPNRYIVYENGVIFDRKNIQFVRQWVDPKGYVYTSFKLIDNSRMAIGLHRIVAFLYCENPYNDYSSEIEVNHKDGVKTNNFYTNLEWTTQQENIEHAFNTGLMYRKYPKELVHKVCQLMETGISPSEIIREIDSKQYSYDEMRRLLQGIRSKHSWTEISSQYNIPDSDYSRKHSEEFVHKICKEIENGKSPLEIAYQFGKNDDEIKDITSLVGTIKQKNAWTEISSKYNFPDINFGRKYDDNFIHKLCILLEQGRTYNEIIAMMNIKDEDKQNIKNLLTDIKVKKRHIDISSNYKIKEKSNQLEDKEKLVHKLCKELEKGIAPIEVINNLGLQDRKEEVKYIISDIKAKKSWNYISCHYNIPEADYSHKYDEDYIYKICKLIEENLSPKEIIERIHNMGYTYTDDEIRDLRKSIVNKECWTHISSKFNIQKTNFKQVFDEDTARKVCQLLQDTDLSYNEIIAKLGLPMTKQSNEFVKNIKNKRAWKRVSKEYNF